MKDALGHGSNATASQRVDFARNRIGIAPGAKFPSALRPVAKPSTSDQVASLRARLSQPKQGLALTFLQGVKNAMGYST